MIVSEEYSIIYNRILKSNPESITTEQCSPINLNFLRVAQEISDIQNLLLSRQYRHRIAVVQLPTSQKCKPEPINYFDQMSINWPEQEDELISFIPSFSGQISNI